MSNEQFAFLKSSRVPTRDQWQQAIERAGFDLQLDPTLEPRKDAGFVQCKLNGAESGVEMYFEDSSELMKTFGSIAVDCDCWISFRWGSSMSECACAMIASFALASEFGAVVSFEGGPPYENLADFRRETEATLKHVKRP
jgi:hypothetical protein